MKTLTVEHLAPYLPYQLTGVWIPPWKKTGKVFRMASLTSVGSIFLIRSTKTRVTADARPIGEFKPLLMPLAQLIVGDNNGMYQLNCMRGVATPFEKYNEFFDDGECIGCKWGGVFSFYFERQTTSFYDNQQSGISPQYDMFQYLFKNHFDVFGLIEAGLAIDKTTY